MSLLGPKGAWAELHRTHAGQVEWSGFPKASCLLSSTTCLLCVCGLGHHYLPAQLTVSSSQAAVRVKEGDLGWVRVS